MQIGDYTYGQENINLIDFGQSTSLKIGKFCSIAADVTIYLGGNHRTDWITTYPFGHIHQDIFPHHGKGHPATKGDVIIGNDVWIGRGATILSGVTIGDGAVIGANAVVAKDISPYAIAAGNPAEEKSHRFLFYQRIALLELKWWDWPIEKINENLELLCSKGGIITLLEKYK